MLLDASSAFTTVPSGFSDLNSSFAASETDDPFQPLFDGRGPGGPGGRWSFGRGPGFGIGFMGGLGGPFLGLGLLDVFHDGSCAFSSSTGVVTCGKQTRGGSDHLAHVQATRTPAAIRNRRSTPRQTQSRALCRSSGTVTRRDSVTSDINESSSQTISGLAKGSTQRKDRRSVGRVGEYERARPRWARSPHSARPATRSPAL